MLLEIQILPLVVEKDLVWHVYSTFASWSLVCTVHNISAHIAKMKRTISISNVTIVERGNIYMAADFLTLYRHFNKK